MRIDGDVALTLAAQISYVDQMGWTGKVRNKDIRKNNTATRQLEENRWRSTDLYDIIQKLDIQQNKFLILRLLPRMDLFEILAFLTKEELLNGLSFFDRERLLFLIMHLPKRMLIQMMLQVFSLKYIVRAMPRDEIFAILKSKKVTMHEMMQAFQFMPLKYIQEIMAKILGRDVSKLRPEELRDILQNQDKRKVLDGMRKLSFKALQPFIYNLIEQNPELLMLLSPKFIFKMMDMLPKQGLIDACTVLPEEMILELLDQLPDFFLAQVADQVNPYDFEHYLLYQQQNLLLYLGGGLDAA